MKITKPFVLLASMFLVAGCTNTAKGAALTVENANEYLAAFKEGEGNANFNDGKVSFNINPNSEKGKLFSPDIKGKCDIKVKYCLGIVNFQFDWSEPYEYKGVEFAYKEGGTNESGFKNMDTLEGVFTASVEFEYQAVNVYDLKVTEISGHMLP